MLVAGAGATVVATEVGVAGATAAVGTSGTAAASVGGGAAAGGGDDVQALPRAAASATAAAATRDRWRRTSVPGFMLLPARF
jgi:hypothetical protein